jgi:hypothetical protein
MARTEEKTMTFVKTLAVGTFLTSTLIAGSAFAKAHEQGLGKNGMFDAGAPGSSVEDTAAAVGQARSGGKAASPEPMGRPDGAGTTPTQPVRTSGN